MSRHRFTRWALWSLSLALLCALAVWRADSGSLIETNIFDLLPGQQGTPALAKAAQRSHDAFSRQLLVVLSGADDGNTRRAAQTAHDALLDAGLVASTNGTDIEQAMGLYRRHGFALLSAAQIQRFRKQGLHALAADVAVALASPAGHTDLRHDPGGYAARFMASLPRPYPDFLPDGQLLSAQRGEQRVFLMRMAMPSGYFGVSGDIDATAAIAKASDAARSVCNTCRLQATGAPLFAHAARDQARSESIWLGVASTLLIMLLIAYVFRSLAPHVLGFLQLGASIVAASAAVIVVFGSIHVLTLVFGTTLLGIAIDYAFLYFSEYWFGRSAPADVIRTVGSGIWVGLLTGVLAFGFMALTGFPALGQMAVFSAVGLIEAALVVVLIFPVTLTRVPTVAVHAAVAWPSRFMQHARKQSRWRYLLPVLVLLLAVPGWWQLHARDDVRSLTHLPTQLVHTDQAVRKALGRFPASGFFLIKATDLNKALAREHELFQRMSAALPDVDAMGLSRFLPPVPQQRASLVMWQSLLKTPADVEAAFANTGLPAVLAKRVEAGWQAADKTPLTAQALLHAVPALQRFVIHADGGVALMATAFGEQSIDAAALDAAAQGLDGVRYVQPLKRYDHIFARIRVRATWLVVLGYVFISAILVWRYGWRDAVRMLYPPLLALAVTLGALGWLGVPLNVFSVVALILILGLGRDYAVFLREVGPREQSTTLSVTLSALTTIIGFGLLAFSQVPALHAFGLATGIGILASFLVAPLSLPPIDGNEA